MSTLDQKSLLQEDVLQARLSGAVHYGNIKMVRSLLAQGADVNERTFHDFTPLMWAAASNQAEIACLLLEHGADPDLKDGRDKTMFDYAGQNFRKNIGDALAARAALAAGKKKVKKTRLLQDSMALKYDLRTKPSPFKKQICRK